MSFATIINISTSVNNSSSKEITKEMSKIFFTNFNALAFETFKHSESNRLLLYTYRS